MVLAVPRSNFPRLAVAGYRLRGCVRYWSRMAFWLGRFRKKPVSRSRRRRLRLRKKRRRKRGFRSPGFARSVACIELTRAMLRPHMAEMSDEHDGSQNANGVLSGLKAKQDGGGPL